MAEDQMTDENETDILVQQAAGLTWDLCAPPLSADVIGEHERMLGIKFPDDFRAVIQTCSGGQPQERSEFWIDHPAHGRLGSGLGALVTFDPADENDGILATTRDLRRYHGVPSAIIPIAVDGGGDFMCLDYSESMSAPSVVYYSHEAPLETAFCHLAASFTEFLAMLEPPEEDPDDID